MKRLLLALAVLATTTNSAQADLLFGVTASDVVVINPSTAGVEATVGPLNLPAGITPSNLTYHPSRQSLFTIAYARSGPTVTNQHLVEINPQTGQGTIAATLGDPAVVGFYEALEFVNSLNSLVASRSSAPGSALTDLLVRVNLDGSTSLLLSTVLDNDYAVYDMTRDFFYTIDPNNVPGQQFFRVNLTTGSVLNLGVIPSTLGEPAFSTDIDAIFALDFTNNNFYRLNLTNGGPPVTTALVGSIPGSQVTGIAFAPTSVVPEPSTMVLFASALAVFGSYRARKWLKRHG